MIAGMSSEKAQVYLSQLEFTSHLSAVRIIDLQQTLISYLTSGSPLKDLKRSLILKRLSSHMFTFPMLLMQSKKNGRLE